MEVYFGVESLQSVDLVVGARAEVHARHFVFAGEGVPSSVAVRVVPI